MRGKVISLALCLLSLFPYIVYGEGLNKEYAVKCIMGEARGEPLESIVATSEAFRNRFDRYGKVWGVDGCKAKFEAPGWVWEKVRMAWERSETSNLTDGADHWFADWILAPYWTKDAEFVAQYGQHRFYKEVK